MPSAVLSTLRVYGGVASWAQLTERLPPHVVTQAVSSGRAVRLLPRVYVEAADANSPQLRLRAALLFAGAGSCLSHATALAQWRPRLHVPFDGRVHVLTPNDRDRRSTNFVHVHRYGSRSIPPDLVFVRRGLPTAAPELALLDTWATLPPAQRRAPLIDAVRLGIITPDRVEALLRDRPKIRGRAELRDLIGMLQAGCRSELELMGFARVFSDPRLPRAERQFTVHIDDRHYLLDVAWPEFLLAVELDGAAYHGSTDARERDVHRDADLARAGWLTVRVTYKRLTSDPAGVITELLEIIAMRRRQLGGSA